MRQIRTLCILIFWFTLLALQAQVADSVVQRIALAAARGEISTLTNLYATNKDSLPAPVKLYCDIALARAEGNAPKVIEAIDTLTEKYSAQLDRLGLVGLAEVKTDALMSLGKYADAANYSQERIDFFGKKKVSGRQLSALRTLHNHAVWLSADTPDTRLLGAAERNDYFQLREILRNEAQNASKYARLLAQLTIEQREGKSKEVLSTCNALLSEFADSLDAAALRRCVQAATDACIAQGKWQELFLFYQKHEGIDKAHGLETDVFQQWAAAFNHADTLSTDRQAKDTVSLPLRWHRLPIVELRLNGSAPIPFVIDTRCRHTFIGRQTARRLALRTAEPQMSLRMSDRIVSTAPTVVASLAFKTTVLRHVPVFVAEEIEESNTGSFQNDSYNIIGIDALKALGCIEISPSSLRIMPADPSMRDSLPNFIVHPVFGLQLSPEEANRMERHSPLLDCDFIRTHGKLRFDFCNMQFTSGAAS